VGAGDIRAADTLQVSKCDENLMRLITAVVYTCLCTSCATQHHIVGCYAASCIDCTLSRFQPSLHMLLLT
jgi:hypothetical protein